MDEGWLNLNWMYNLAFADLQPLPCLFSPSSQRASVRTCRSCQRVCLQGRTLELEALAHCSLQKLGSKKSGWQIIVERRQGTCLGAAWFWGAGRALSPPGGPGLPQASRGCRWSVWWSSRYFNVVNLHLKGKHLLSINSVWTAHLRVLYRFKETRLEEWDVNLQKRWLSAGEDCSVLQSRVWLLKVFMWLRVFLTNTRAASSPGSDCASRGSELPAFS